MPDRPQLFHEKLAEQLRKDLEYAQTVDLTPLSWRDLALIRGDVCQSQVLERACGKVATKEVWTAARDRIQARMDEIAAAQRQAASTKRAMRDSKPK